MLTALSCSALKTSQDEAKEAQDAQGRIQRVKSFVVDEDRDIVTVLVC